MCGGVNMCERTKDATHVREQTKGSLARCAAVLKKGCLVSSHVVRRHIHVNKLGTSTMCGGVNMCEQRASYTCVNKGTINTVELTKTDWLVRAFRSPPYTCVNKGHENGAQKGPVGSNVSVSLSFAKLLTLG